MNSHFSFTVRIAIMFFASVLSLLLVSGFTSSSDAAPIPSDQSNVTNDMVTPASNSTTGGSGGNELDHSSSNTTGDDRLNNAIESVGNTNSLIEDTLEPVVASLELVADKTIRISWQPTLGAQYYRVLEKSDGLSSFVRVSEDLKSTTQIYDHRVALYKKVNARYIVQACKADSCVNSEELIMSGSIVNAIGYFKASNAEKRDIFGFAVSLNAGGTVMAISAPEEQSAAAGVNGNQNDNSAKRAGAVYVFKRSNDQWQQQAYLKPSNPDQSASFGNAISLNADGDMLAIGSYEESSAATGINGNQNDYSDTVLPFGAVYVFTNNDGNWQQRDYIKASNTGLGDLFGSDVVLSEDGNTMVVSASGESSGATGVNGDEGDNYTIYSGAVYVFVNVNGIWKQEAYLKASNTDEFDAFGRALGLSADGNTLAVGAIGESSAATGVNGNQSNNNAPGAGAVYIFERINGNWQQRSYLKASNTDAEDLFGDAVSLSADGKILVVGASGESSAASEINGDQNDNSSIASGAAYVFVKSDGSWQQQAYIKGSHVDDTRFFGSSVSLSGNGSTLVVSEGTHDRALPGNSAYTLDASLRSYGAVYVFKHSDGSWRQLDILRAINPDKFDEFGYSVSLSKDGGTLAVGAPYENNLATGVNGNQNGGSLESSGAAYLY